MTMKLEITEIIKRPLISEKSTWLAGARNAYTFEVDKRADKGQIKTAVETLFKVKVADVRTVVTAGKPKRTKSGEITVGALKKAVVVLHEDNKIDLF
ncbi:MAG: 50S ribosomal protein L23 [Phycisphaerae bacterium]|jgi:large subunit ribosomal protein L23